MNYTFYADLGLTLDKPTNLNYRFSLPNKVFDYMHAETPILATSILEVKNIVEKHKIGVVIQNFSSKNLAEMINEIFENENLLLEMKKNCKKAKLLENWKNEEVVLNQIYNFDGK
ncbi:MAG: glycosyltransferase [Flavobacteriia bacterium]|nr:glycosyltransferase [Flavobacteriia bacterium]